MALLQVNNLTISYDAKQVVNDCSFQIEKGEIVVLLAASGEGKTSILKAIAGKIQPQSGELSFLGDKILGPQDQLIAGRDEVQLVDQDFGLDDYHTVRENINLKLLQFDQEHKDSQIKVLLDLCGLTGLADQKAHLLSGGQKQRLAIARALAIEPELLLLDEPFNQLDFKSKTKISTYLRDYLIEKELSVIMVTHNGLEALEWADRIIHLQDGKIQRIDSTEAFYNNPKSIEEATFFGAVNLIKLDGGSVTFRPNEFALNQIDEFSFRIPVDFLSKKSSGWFDTYRFSSEGQEIQLFSTTDISQIDEIFVKSFSLVD